MTWKSYGGVTLLFTAVVTGTLWYDRGVKYVSLEDTAELCAAVTERRLALTHSRMSLAPPYTEETYTNSWVDFNKSYTVTPVAVWSELSSALGELKKQVIHPYVDNDNPTVFWLDPGDSVPVDGEALISDAVTSWVSSNTAYGPYTIRSWYDTSDSCVPLMRTMSDVYYGAGTDPWVGEFSKTWWEERTDPVYVYRPGSFSLVDGRGGPFAITREGRYAEGLDSYFWGGKGSWWASRFGSTNASGTNFLFRWPSYEIPVCTVLTNPLPGLWIFDPPDPVVIDDFRERAFKQIAVLDEARAVATSMVRSCVFVYGWEAWRSNTVAITKEASLQIDDFRDFPSHSDDWNSMFAEVMAGATTTTNSWWPVVGYDNYLRAYASYSSSIFDPFKYTKALVAFKATAFENLTAPYPSVEALSAGVVKRVRVYSLPVGVPPDPIVPDNSGYTVSGGSDPTLSRYDNDFLWTGITALCGHSGPSLEFNSSTFEDFGHHSSHWWEFDRKVSLLVDTGDTYPTEPITFNLGNIPDAITGYSQNYQWMTYTTDEDRRLEEHRQYEQIIDFSELMIIVDWDWTHMK